MDQEIARVGAGAIVGEMALLDGQPRSATVSAVDAATLYRIDRAAFTVLRANLRPAAFKVIRTLARTLCARLREINGSIEEFWADPERSLAEMKERQAKVAAEVKARMTARAASPAPAGGAPMRVSLPGRAAPKPMTKSWRKGDDAAAMAAFLADVPLLRGLAPKEIDVLAQIVKARVVADGAVVCKEGDAGDGFDVVSSGGVHVVKELKTGFRKTLATAGVGAVFGEVSLIDGKKRSASVYAMGETTLLVCGRAEELLEFRASSPFAFRFVERIAVDLSRRVREADDLFTSIYSRVGETMTELEAQLLEIQGSLEGGAWPTDTETLLKLVGYDPSRSP
jgi:CRP-like cAMP-binding protein